MSVTITSTDAGDALNTEARAAVNALIAAAMAGEGQITASQAQAITASDTLRTLDANNRLLSLKDPVWRTPSLVAAINVLDGGADPTAVAECAMQFQAQMYACLAGPVRSTATGGTTTTLADSAVNFVSLGVTVGMIVVRYNNGAAEYATITAVATGSVSVASWPNGVAPVQFEPYVIIPPSTQTRYGLYRFLAPGNFRVGTTLSLKSVQNFHFAGSGFCVGGTNNGLQTRITGQVTGTSSAVLDLHGCSYSLFEGFQLQGDGTTTPDHVLYVHQDVQPGTSDPQSTTTRCRFQDILLTGKWKVAGYRLGSDGGTTFDESLMVHVNLHALGAYSPGSGGGSFYTHGFYIGTGNSGNNLQHDFIGCKSISVQNSVSVNDSGPLTFIGGCYEDCDTVWYVPQLTGPLTAIGVYSESFLKWIVQQTPGSTTMVMKALACTVNMNKVQADTLPNFTSGGTGALDVIQIGGTLCLDLSGTRFSQLGNAGTLNGTSAANGSTNTVQVGGKDGALFGEIISMTSGACSGQQRRITAHASGVATVTPNWTTSAPASGDTWTVAQTPKIRLPSNFFASVTGTDVCMQQGRPDTVFCGLLDTVLTPNPAIDITLWREMDSSTETRQGWGRITNQPTMGTARPGAVLAHGAMTIQGIANPANAPQLGGAGNTGGSASRKYGIIYHDSLGNPTLMSPVATTATAQAPLSAAAPITVTSNTWRGDVASFTVVVSTDGGTTWAALCIQQTSGNVTLQGGFRFIDTGQPTIPYTLPTRNATADATFSGLATFNGPTAGLDETDIAPVAFTAKGNIAGALALPWTQAQQKFTCTATVNNGVVTIQGIPAGGSMVVQLNSGAGSLATTFAVGSGLGTLRWFGGAPTTTLVANKIDEFLFAFNGTDTIAYVIGQAA